MFITNTNIIWLIQNVLNFISGDNSDNLIIAFHIPVYFKLAKYVNGSQPLLITYFFNNR